MTRDMVMGCNVDFISSAFVFCGIARNLLRCRWFDADVHIYLCSAKRAVSGLTAISYIWIIANTFCIVNDSLKQP
jgi:hypothetical protein